MTFIFLVSSDDDPYRILPDRVTESVKISVSQEYFPLDSGMDFTEMDWLGNSGHLLEYILLGLTAANAFIWKQKPGGRLLAKTLLISLIFSLSDEIHQLFTPNRCFQVRDLQIDAAGILIGLYLFFIIQTFMLEKSNRQNHAAMLLSNRNKDL